MYNYRHGRSWSAAKVNSVVASTSKTTVGNFWEMERSAYRLLRARVSTIPCPASHPNGDSSDTTDLSHMQTANRQTPPICLICKRRVVRHHRFVSHTNGESSDTTDLFAMLHKKPVKAVRLLPSTKGKLSIGYVFRFFQNEARQRLTPCWYGPHVASVAVSVWQYWFLESPTSLNRWRKSLRPNFRCLLDLIRRENCFVCTELESQGEGVVWTNSCPCTGRMRGETECSVFITCCFIIGMQITRKQLFPDTKGNHKKIW